MNTPYTHAQHADRCREAAQHRVVLIQFVQVNARQVTYCGRIKEAFTLPDGLDLWRIELLGPATGLQSFPCNRVRQCSGVDGRCTCAGEQTYGLDGAAKRSVAAPDGQGVLA